MTNQIINYPKAILFDMDGVLIDSQHAWWKAINVALSCSNHATITKKEFIDNLWGNDFKTSISYLGIKANVFLDCKEWTQTYLDYVLLKKDVISTLSSLKQSFPLAVITNTQRFITEQVLNRFHLTSFFNAVVCADDVKKGKPAPDIIYQACKQLNVSTSEVIVVGDTKSDLNASKSAGCEMIGMNFNNGGKIIHNLSELPAVIKKVSKQNSLNA